MARHLDDMAGHIQGHIAAAAAGAADVTMPREFAQRAARALREAGNIREPPPPDNTLRDIMAHEAARAMRSDRERLIAKSEINDDEEFIRDMRSKMDGKLNKIANLISLTARFAGELQHNLIHPDLRYRWKEEKQNGRDGPEAINSTQWTEIVDPGLVGNARITCQNIADAHPRLQGLQVEWILDSADGSVLDFFCAAVAARWRANSVFAAGPYKTGNEQQAVLHALNEAVSLFRDYAVRDNQLISSPRPRVTTLSQIRGLGGAILPD
jgi:hypothetical protein